MRILFIFLFFSFHCFSFPEVVQITSEKEQQKIQDQTKAPPAPLQFNREKIATFKKQPEFDYTDRTVQENWWKKFKRYTRLQWQKLLNWLFKDHRPNSLVVFLLEMLPYLILAGTLVFSVWLFVKLNPQNFYLGDRKAGSVFLNEEEEIIRSKDIRKSLKQALAAENYRLAVRFHYLLLLQQLSKAGFIDYQFPKTDEEYLAEIKQERLKEQFRKINHIYDFIWYGSFEVSAENYPRARREFEKLEELINIKDDQNL